MKYYAWIKSPWVIILLFLSVCLTDSRVCTNCINYAPIIAQNQNLRTHRTIEWVRFWTNQRQTNTWSMAVEMAFASAWPPCRAGASRWRMHTPPKRASVVSSRWAHCPNLLQLCSPHKLYPIPPIILQFFRYYNNTFLICVPVYLSRWLSRVTFY